jgi:hypothetical protein
MIVVWSDNLGYSPTTANKRVRRWSPQWVTFVDPDEFGAAST